jgi:hypothetical protein
MRNKTIHGENSDTEMLRSRTRVAVFVCLFFTAAVAAIYPESVIVDYLEGFVERSTNSHWEEVYIGDELSIDSTIRVSENGFAEFSMGDLKISVKEDGIYQLSDLVGASKQVNSWGLGSLVSTKIRSALTSSPASGETAVMGVRGAVAESGAGVEWVEAGGTEELLQEGMELLEKTRYSEALDVFNEGLSIACGEEEQQFLYYIGYAQALQGYSALALNTLERVDVDPQTNYYSDLVLLRGRMLIESLAFEEALEFFKTHTNRYPEGELTQAVLIMSSYCHRGLDDTFQALQVLQRAMELDPDSALGKEARRLMEEL